MVPVQPLYNTSSNANRSGPPAGGAVELPAYDYSSGVDDGSYERYYYDYAADNRPLPFCDPRNNSYCTDWDRYNLLKQGADQVEFDGAPLTEVSANAQTDARTMVAPNLYAGTLGVQSRGTVNADVLAQLGNGGVQLGAQGALAFLGIDVGDGRPLQLLPRSVKFGSGALEGGVTVTPFLQRARYAFDAGPNLGTPGFATNG